MIVEVHPQRLMNFYFLKVIQTSVIISLINKTIGVFYFEDVGDIAYWNLPVPLPWI